MDVTIAIILMRIVALALGTRQENANGEIRRIKNGGRSIVGPVCLINTHKRALIVAVAKSATAAGGRK